MVERKIYSSIFALFVYKLTSLCFLVPVFIMNIDFIINKNRDHFAEGFSYVHLLAISIFVVLYAYFGMIKVKYLFYENGSFFIISFFMEKRITHFRYIFSLPGYGTLVYFSYIRNNKKYWACTALKMLEYRALLEELKSVNQEK